MPRSVSALSLLSSIHLLQSLSSQTEESAYIIFLLKMLLWLSTTYTDYKYKLSREAQKGLHHLSPPTYLSSWSRPPLPHTSDAPGTVDAHCREDRQVQSRVPTPNNWQWLPEAPCWELKILINLAAKMWWMILQCLLLVWGRGCHTHAIPQFVYYCSLTVLPRCCFCWACSSPVIPLLILPDPINRAPLWTCLMSHQQNQSLSPCTHTAFCMSLLFGIIGL